jgi:hypothetical protein
MMRKVEILDRPILCHILYRACPSIAKRSIDATNLAGTVNKLARYMFLWIPQWKIAICFLLFLCQRIHSSLQWHDGAESAILTLFRRPFGEFVILRLQTPKFHETV